MSEFYIVTSVLLVIAIINLWRALKEDKSNGRVLGVTINVVAIVLLALGLVIGGRPKKQGVRK